MKMDSIWYLHHLPPIFLLILFIITMEIPEIFAKGNCASLGASFRKWASNALCAVGSEGSGGFEDAIDSEYTERAGLNEFPTNLYDFRLQIVDFEQLKPKKNKTAEPICGLTSEQREKQVGICKDDKKAIFEHYNEEGTVLWCFNDALYPRTGESPNKFAPTNKEVLPENFTATAYLREDEIVQNKHRYYHNWLHYLIIVIKHNCSKNFQDQFQLIEVNEGSFDKGNSNVMMYAAKRINLCIENNFWDCWDYRPTNKEFIEILTKTIKEDKNLPNLKDEKIAQTTDPALIPKTWEERNNKTPIAEFNKAQ